MESQLRIIPEARAREFVRHRGPVTSVSLAQGSEQVVSCGYDGALATFDLRSGQASLRGYHPHLINRLVSSGDGRTVATCSSDYSIGIWTLDGSRPPRQLLGHYDDVEDFVFIDDTRAASASRDRRIIVWDLEAGGIIRILEGHERDVLALASSEDGRLFSSGDDMTLRVWQTATGRLLSTFGPFDTETDTCAMAPGSDRAVLGCDDGHVRVFNVDSGELIADLRGHRSGVKKVAISPLNGDLLSAGYDQRIVVWDAETLQPKLELPPTTGIWERSLCFSADGERILAGTFDGTVLSFRADTGEPEFVLGAEGSPPGNACFNDISCGPGGVFVTVSDDGLVRSASVQASATPPRIVAPAQGRVLMNAVEVSPDGRVAAAGTHDGRVLLYSLSEGAPELRASAELGCGPVNSLSFRGGPVQSGGEGGELEREVFAGCYSGAIVALRGDGVVRDRIELHEGAVKAICLFARGSRGVSCGADGLLLSWSTQGELLERFVGHTAIINDVDVDPGGRYLASISRDFSLKIWELETGKLLHIHLFGRRSLKSVCFFGSNLVVVGDYWGAVHSVELDSGKHRHKPLARNGISALARCGDEILATSYAGATFLVDPVTLDERKRFVAMDQRVDAAEPVADLDMVLSVRSGGRPPR